MRQTIINDLVCQYEDDAAAGLLVVQARLTELLPDIEDDRVIFSNVEGNIFKWQEEQMTTAEWFSIWAAVKKELQAKIDGVPKRTGIFTPRFCNIQH